MDFEGWVRLRRRVVQSYRLTCVLLGAVHVCAALSNVLCLEFHGTDVPFWNALVGKESIISDGKGDAGSKTAAMESAGITVSPSPARLGHTLAKKLKS